MMTDIAGIEMNNWRCKFCHHLLAKINEAAVTQILMAIKGSIASIKDVSDFIEIRCSKCKTMNTYYLCH